MAPTFRHKRMGDIIFKSSGSTWCRDGTEGEREERENGEKKTEKRRRRTVCIMCLCEI